eukprot:1158168-Pelagomonas_calceolata.AAC.3
MFANGARFARKQISNEAKPLKAEGHGMKAMRHTIGTSNKQQRKLRGKGGEKQLRSRRTLRRLLSDAAVLQNLKSSQQWHGVFSHKIAQVPEPWITGGVLAQVPGPHILNYEPA